MIDVPYSLAAWLLAGVVVFAALLHFSYQNPYKAVARAEVIAYGLANKLDLFASNPKLKSSYYVPPYLEENCSIRITKLGENHPTAVVVRIRENTGVAFLFTDQVKETELKCKRLVLKKEENEVLVAQA